jgi:hypothetical protein
MSTSSIPVPPAPAPVAPAPTVSLPPGVIPLPPGIVADAPPAPPPAVKKGKLKRKSISDTGKSYRAVHFPHIQDDGLWSSQRGGWASVPRPAGLIANVVIKEAYRNKFGGSSAAGTTYSTLWLHWQGYGMARIESEADAALESGYGGERGITTFRRHIKTLRDLGFIEYHEESRGRVKWVLMHSPYQIVKKLYEDGLIARATFTAVTERADSIGVGVEFDAPEVRDGSE